MEGVLDTYNKAFFTNNPIGTRPDLMFRPGEEGATCKQRCIGNRHCIWTVAVAFGTIMTLTGAGFCIFGKAHLLIPGIVMSLSGMAFLVAGLLFAGMAESIANEPIGLPVRQLLPSELQQQGQEETQPLTEPENSDNEDTLY